MQAFTDKNSLYQAAADAVRNAAPGTLAPNSFMNTSGCLCAAGQLVYQREPLLKKAVDGYRSLREAGILDEDQIDIIATSIGDKLTDAFNAATFDLRELDDTVRLNLYLTFDTEYEGDAETTARAIEELITLEDAIAA